MPDLMSNGKFYLTARCFPARVQSSTCTTYVNYQRENLMTVLTPKSGIINSPKISNCKYGNNQTLIPEGSQLIKKQHLV